MTDVAEQLRRALAIEEASARLVRAAGGWLPGDARRPRSRGIDDDPACWLWPRPLPDAATWLAAVDGLSPEKDVESRAQSLLHSWQDDCCAGCGAAGQLVTDHDHGTGLVCGLLCRGCNAQEPHAMPDTRLAKYRARPPVTLLGLTPWAYYSAFDWS